MSKQLVIVESPTKAKTISRFLGKDYKIMSSYGHIRDLPEKELGVDIQHNFQPKYVVSRDKKPIVDELKKAAQKAELVYFATDEDREGEAISWHLLNLLSNGQPLNYRRIAFHEITQQAVLHALEHPREIDLNLVDAQQARRVLDRLVGYKLSPFLWKKVSKGLSAGRVQSVAVRLIVEREREIKAFQPQEYWSLKALLQADQATIEASLFKIGEHKLDKLELKSAEQVDKIVADLKTAHYLVEAINQKQTTKKAPAPFTTSSLQQEAHNKLGFSAKQTMYIAQALYEGVKVDKEQVGLITYMRTDSVNLADSFIEQAREYINQQLGADYLPAQPVKYKAKSKNAQEAHEAIRPTDIYKTPEQVKPFLDDKQYKLYTLIWQRALACQIKPAQINSTTVEIKADQYGFKAIGSTIKFDGWLKIYPAKVKDSLLPSLTKGQELKLNKLEPKQSFTEPPPRYNDASLVKKLEELEIGRPSTYAPIISTIQQRNYIKREQGRFVPQDIAFVVIDLLKDHFPQIVDYQFTAKMEEKLDQIAQGKIKWMPVIAEFYQPFQDNLEKKYKEINKSDLTEESSDEICDKCGRPMIIKTSRYGRFLACSGFPNCRNTKSLDEKGQAVDKAAHSSAQPQLTDLKCDKCGSPMLIRQGRFGKFYACSNFPKCKNTKPLDQDTGITCPQCGQGTIVAKKTKTRRTFYACSNYPQCKFALWAKPTGEKCPQCGSLLINAGKGKVKCSNQDCNYVSTQSSTDTT